MSYRTFCRGCGAPDLDLVLDLGVQPLANGLLESPLQKEAAYPLELAQCMTCTLLQLNYDVPPGEIFNGAYPFTTKSAGAAWLEHGRRLAAGLTLRLGLNPHSRVMEIGSNDGSFLANFNVHQLIGVDPSAPPHTPNTVREFFGSDWIPPYKQDLIYGVNVLAHMPLVVPTVQALERSLADEGTAVFEFPWAYELLRQNQFDTIYHEHYSYFTISSLDSVLRRFGLHIYDAEFVNTHGGSLRVFIGRRQRESMQLRGLWLLEQACIAGMVQQLPQRVRAVKDEFRRFLDDHPRQVMAYGAAAKGNTFLNYCNVSTQDIVAVGDSSVTKIGRYLPGSRIPIVDEAGLVMWQPRYVVVLPWNWAESIVDRLAPLMPATSFLTAIPKVTYVGPSF